MTKLELSNEVLIKKCNRLICFARALTRQEMKLFFLGVLHAKFNYFFYSLSATIMLQKRIVSVSEFMSFHVLEISG